MLGGMEAFKNSEKDNNKKNVQGVFKAGKTRKGINLLPREHEQMAQKKWKNPTFALIFKSSASQSGFQKMLVL